MVITGLVSRNASAKPSRIIYTRRADQSADVPCNMPQRSQAHPVQITAATAIFGGHVCGVSPVLAEGQAEWTGLQQCPAARGAAQAVICWLQMLHCILQGQAAQAQQSMRGQATAHPAAGPGLTLPCRCQSEGCVKQAAALTFEMKLRAAGSGVVLILSIRPAWSDRLCKPWCCTRNKGAGAGCTLCVCCS